MKDFQDLFYKQGYLLYKLRVPIPTANQHTIYSSFTSHISLQNKIYEEFKYVLYGPCAEG